MKFETLDQFSEDLATAYKSKTPFSAVSIGDGECLFLLDIPYCQPDARNGIYHNSSELEEKIRKQTLDLLKTTDYIFSVDSPQEYIDECRGEDKPVWQQHIHSVPKVIEVSNAVNCKIADLEDRYKMPISGHLFKAIPTAKILFIGFYALQIKDRCNVTSYRKFYGMGDGYVDYISCPKTNSIEYLDVIMQKLEKLKPFLNYDVALVGMGIPANYICLKIKEMGGIAIDLGQAISFMAGDTSDKRKHCEEYLK
jgi:hypothetical protein